MLTIKDKKHVCFEDLIRLMPSHSFFLNFLPIFYSVWVTFHIRIWLHKTDKLFSDGRHISQIYFKLIFDLNCSYSWSAMLKEDSGLGFSARFRKQQNVPKLQLYQFKISGRGKLAQYDLMSIKIQLMWVFV